jgi:DNA invertase Pin-like site-specific DNA recombinase
VAKRPPKPVPGGARSIRCAIYTRKSTEEGLDQAFNSLDAQREACAAYILSQRHEGWTLVKGNYDDGGFSGGNMERPGLKRLLADVKSGQVDVIVVYKVDRLTRALSDFAKIVEILDARGASFVSITQSFNTTTSMGRLTLNVLLSFAQFEREVTGERIRDKIAASKKKGIWMGGNVPLGYRVEDRKLIVVESEAEQVRHILQRYVELGSGRALIEDLRITGYRTRRSATRGGIPWSRGPLFYLLSNRIYLGEIVHQGVAYPGEHQPIVSTELWDAVQQTMAGNRVARGKSSNTTEHSLLAGLLFDGEGRRMSPSHATKGARRYRYYVTPASELSDADRPAWRVPAHDLETAVVSRIRQMLSDRSMLTNLVPTHHMGGETYRRAIALAADAATRLAIPDARRALVRSIVSIIKLCEDRIAIDLNAVPLLELLGIDVDPDRSGIPITIVAPASRFRRGNDVRLVVTDTNGRAASVRDATIVALLGEARLVYDQVIATPDRSIRQFAAETGSCRSRIARLVRIALLAPDIVADCLNGTHPATLTRSKILAADLPIAWSDQRAILGFR